MEQLYSPITEPSALDLSTSTSDGNNNGIVFVSHHRQDVGKTFASQLSGSLISRGWQIGSIYTAFVFIVIFSKSYANSASCLDELLIIYQSGAPFIPIFLDVDPSDLLCLVTYTRVLRTFRWTSVKNGSPYAEDLRTLEEEKTCAERPRYDPDKIREWGEALFNSARMCGFERVGNRSEGHLVHDVVDHVSKIKCGICIDFDVFINHRGRDAKDMASHIYYRLLDDGLKVFFDKEAQRGYNIKSMLERAIGVASVHIAIFTRNYAESEWCLDELLLMVESEAIIIPVFCGLKRAEMWSNPVDGMKGVYDEALLKLKEEKIFNPETGQEEPRYDSHTIDKWWKTLREVTGRDGLDLETYDGDEGKLVDNVVKEVKSKVQDSEAKYLNEGCLNNNVSSSEGERYVIVRDQKAYAGNLVIKTKHI